MERVETEPRLNDLSTQWTMLFDAHLGDSDQSNEALRMMMLRYSGAVHRYLLKTVGNEEEVQELDQEFALRFLKGNFLKYDPSAGRFRDYVKGAVRNLMLDHHRKKGKKGKPRHLDTSLEMSIVGDDGLENLDEQIREAWRDDLLDRSWQALKEFEARSHQPYYLVLKTRVQYPDETATQMAERISQSLGRTMSAGAFRQMLQRAREVWTKLLVDEVKVGLKNPSRENVEDELAQLRLLHLCKPILQRIDLD